MSARSQKPRLATLPALMFVGGLGMVFHYGHAWWQLPVYSPAEVEQSVEINLAIDLQRRGAAFAADPAQVERLRDEVRAEVSAAIAHDHSEAKGYVGVGLILAAIGLVQMLVLRRIATR